jgi:hypothetical protein
MEKPQSFVLMPFAQDFDTVYSLFILPTLSDAGYEVKRADEIRSTQNILRDIVSGIVNSELVVADLTDSNPNVYYELGLAHALGKPVIMLTQSIDELPFDLKSYRVVPYTTHFADIQKARIELLDLAKGCLDRSIPFGNPVGDFLPTSSQRFPEKVTEQDELGPLDYLADLEEGFLGLVAIVGETNEETNKINKSTTATATRLNAAGASPGTYTARELKNLVAALGMQLSNYADSLAARNERYSTILLKTRTALEWIAQSQNPKTDDEKAKVDVFRQQLQSMRETGEQTSQALADLIVTLKALPPSERSFQRAKAKAQRELERYRENIDQTNSMAARASDILDSRITPS